LRTGDGSADERPQRADQSAVTNHEPATINPETSRQPSRAPANMPEAPQPLPTIRPSGLRPGRYPVGRHADMNLQPQINPLASADAGGTAGHDAAACVSARGKCDGASVCDARDARMISPTTLPLQARQVVAPHPCTVLQYISYNINIGNSNILKRPTCGLPVGLELDLSRA